MVTLKEAFAPAMVDPLVTPTPFTVNVPPVGPVMSAVKVTALVPVLPAASVPVTV